MRQVLACTVDPGLIDSKVYSEDVTKRAKMYLNNIRSAGAYTPSLGIPLIRKNVAKFIEQKYGVPTPDIKNIFLT